MSEAAPEGGGGGGGGDVLVPLFLLGLGGYFLWFGVHYWRGQGAAVWPSYPIKSVLQGQGLPANNQATAASAEVTAFETSITTAISASDAASSAAAGGTGASGSGGSGSGAAAPPAVPSGSAQNTAQMLLGQFGWGTDQMSALIALWNRESGWSSSAKNTSSGAYGIAQALGHGTPGSAGSQSDMYGAEYGLTTAQAQAANSGSALDQILWGLGYIKSRYGSPSAAWAHETAYGWY